MAAKSRYMKFADVEAATRRFLGITNPIAEASRWSPGAFLTFLYGFGALYGGYLKL